MHNPHGGGNTYILERTLDQDMLLSSVGWANSYYAIDTYSQDGETYTDEWGITWRNVPYQTRFGAGHYTEMVGHPLADDRAIESYRAPDPNRPELYAEAERVIQKYKQEYWIVGVRSPMFRKAKCMLLVAETAPANRRRPEKTLGVDERLVGRGLQRTSQRPANPRRIGACWHHDDSPGRNQGRHPSDVGREHLSGTEPTRGAWL